MNIGHHKVIFVHGLGQSVSSWDKTVSLLSKNISSACFSLFPVNKEKGITYENLYHRFEQYCMKETEPLNLCGISLGAVLSLNYAINNPTKVQSLLFIAPQYKMPRLLLKFQNLLFFFFPKSYFQEVGMTKKGMISLTKSMLDLDFEDNLCNILCPTWIVCGEKDIANKKAAIRMKEGISKSRLYFVKNAGHEVNVEAPNQLADLLNSFYSGIDN